MGVALLARSLNRKLATLEMIELVYERMNSRTFTFFFSIHFYRHKTGLAVLNNIFEMSLKRRETGQGKNKYYFSTYTYMCILQFIILNVQMFGSRGFDDPSGGLDH